MNTISVVVVRGVNIAVWFYGDYYAPVVFFSGAKRSPERHRFYKVTKAEKLICYDNNEPKRVSLYFYNISIQTLFEKTKGVFGNIDLEHLDI